MVLKGNHFFNMFIWLILIAFMTYQSINHTISVHDQGVGVAIKDYQMQSQARINYLNSTSAAQKIRTATLSDAFTKISRIKREMDVYKNIELNEDLTTFIDNHVDTFLLTSKEKLNLIQLQNNLKLESLIFHSHLQSFNRLVQRLPYSLFASNYPIVIFENIPTINGVVVER